MFQYPVSDFHLKKIMKKKPTKSKGMEGKHLSLLPLMKMAVVVELVRLVVVEHVAELVAVGLIDPSVSVLTAVRLTRLPVRNFLFLPSWNEKNHF